METLKEENAELKNEIEALKANTVNISELIGMIGKMDAENLEAQKIEIINFITGKTSEKVSEETAA